jgi:hypothetical protein
MWFLKFCACPWVGLRWLCKWLSSGIKLNANKSVLVPISIDFLHTWFVIAIVESLMVSHERAGLTIMWTDDALVSHRSCRHSTRCQWQKPSNCRTREILIWIKQGAGEENIPLQWSSSNGVGLMACSHRAARSQLSDHVLWHMHVLSEYMRALSEYMRVLSEYMRVLSKYMHVLSEYMHDCDWCMRRKHYLDQDGWLYAWLHVRLTLVIARIAHWHLPEVLLELQEIRPK